LLNHPKKQRLQEKPFRITNPNWLRVENRRRDRPIRKRRAGPPMHGIFAIKVHDGGEAGIARENRFRCGDPISLIVAPFNAALTNHNRFN